MAGMVVARLTVEVVDVKIERFERAIISNQHLRNR